MDNISWSRCDPRDQNQRAKFHILVATTTMRPADGADTPRFQKRLGLSRGVTLLSVKNVAELIVIDRVMLRMAGVGRRSILVQAISVDTGVRSTKVGPPGIVYRACCKGIVKCH